MIDLSQLEVEPRDILPPGYYRVMELNLTNVSPWYFLDTQECRKLMVVLRRLYPAHAYLPFARRTDTDDTACIDINSDLQSSIWLIHLYAEEGWEQDHVYDTFWDWYRDAVDTFIDLETSR